MERNEIYALAAQLIRVANAQWYHWFWSARANGHHSKDSPWLLLYPIAKLKSNIKSWPERNPYVNSRPDYEPP